MRWHFRYSNFLGRISWPIDFCRSSYTAISQCLYRLPSSVKVSTRDVYRHLTLYPYSRFLLPPVKVLDQRNTNSLPIIYSYTPQREDCELVWYLLSRCTYQVTFTNMFVQERKINKVTLNYYKWPIGIMVRVSANGLGDRSSISGQPKTQKMILDASLINTRDYKIRIKGNWNNSRKGVALSRAWSCCSYWKESFRFSLYYGRPTYLLQMVFVTCKDQSTQQKSFGLVWFGLLGFMAYQPL